MEEGDTVIHQKFGMGVITSIDIDDEDEIATIDFDRAGVRMLRLGYCSPGKNRLKQIFQGGTTMAGVSEAYK